MINEHKPTVELNNNNTDNTNTTITNNNTDIANTNNINNINTDNNDNDNNYNNNNRPEWKIQLIIKNNFISVKDFEDTRTIYSASKPVEIFTGSETENIIDTFFDTILNKIQQAMETSNERGSGYTHESVGSLYYHFQRIDIRRGWSYIAPSDWTASKKAIINPKNEKDNECFKWPIIAGLNYNKIKEKELN